jgi:hypothetical protein
MSLRSRILVSRRGNRRRLWVLAILDKWWDIASFVGDGCAAFVGDGCATFVGNGCCRIEGLNTVHIEK